MGPPNMTKVWNTPGCRPWAASKAPVSARPATPRVMSAEAVGTTRPRSSSARVAARTMPHATSAGTGLLCSPLWLPRGGGARRGWCRALTRRRAERSIEQRLERPAAEDRLRPLGDDVRAGARLVVAALDQQPLRLGALAG